MAASGWQVGIDIGGTFTDLVALLPSSGEVRSIKVPTQRNDPVASIMAALAAAGLASEEVDDLIHGTTLVTNAIVEDRVDPVALVATRGFEDVLDIGRGGRQHLYRLDLPPRRPSQVPPDRRIGLAERVDHTGAAVLAPDGAAIADAVARVKATGVESVAVSLFHAYANPAHERAVGEALAAALPFVSLSHEVNPETREFERTATTVLNASVMPIAARYLDRLQREVKGARLHVMHSAGGMASPEAAARRPLAMALSGPAAGVSAAAHVAAALGLDKVLSFDMGGTTTDVCLIIGRRAPEISTDSKLAGRPVRQPMVAVESIGAGGGSLVTHGTGGLSIGPESAGAEPGPAAYGRGGTRPTVTDANAVLGYLDPTRRLGGAITLDVAAAEAALAPLAQAPRRQRHRAGAGRAARRQCHDGAGAGAGHRGARRRRTAMHAARLRRRRPHACRPPRARVRHRRDRRAALFVGLLRAGLHRGRHELHPAAIRAHAEHPLGRRPLSAPCRTACWRRLMEPLQRQGHRRRRRSPSSAPPWCAMSARALPSKCPSPIRSISPRWAAISAAVINDIYGYATDEHWEMQSLRIRTLVAAADDVRTAGGVARRAGADQRRPVLVRAAGAAPDAALRSRSPAGRRADRRARRSSRMRGRRSSCRPATSCSADEMGHLWIKEAGVMKNSIDPFTVEVIRHALTAAAEEMSFVVMRSARSPLLREAGDLSSALTDHKGDLIAQGRDIPIHLGVMSFTVKKFLERVPAERLQPGDVWFLNLPEVGGNHLPDVKAIRPIFLEGRLFAFAVSLAHWGDIGGAWAGSYFAAATETWQEGVRIPPLRLFTADGVDQEKLDFLLANLRGPAEREGDILAQMAATRAAEARLVRLCEEHGAATIRAALDRLDDLSEAQMREAIAGLPDGVYEGEDFLDDDGPGRAARRRAGAHRDHGRPRPLRLQRQRRCRRAARSTRRPSSPWPRSTTPSRRSPARRSSPTAAATARSR